MFENLLELAFQSVVMSIIASIIFLFLLFFLRPRVKIAEKIAFKNGQYTLKVVNRSFFKLIDVHVELVVLKPFNSGAGKNLRIQGIELKKHRIWYIAAKPFREKKSHYGSHAIIFSITDNEAIENWDSEKGETLHFKVIAKHGLSSFMKITTFKYHDKEDDIVKGKFGFGNNCEIIKLS